MRKREMHRKKYSLAKERKKERNTREENKEERKERWE